MGSSSLKTFFILLTLSFIGFILGVAVRNYWFWFLAAIPTIVLEIWIIYKFITWKHFWKVVLPFLIIIFIASPESAILLVFSLYILRQALLCIKESSKTENNKKIYE
ncbi:hypothetical protein [Methanocaldococcus sp.]|uniref:hypothetical protein n=1 Tax=Methanocaldococcus sp. TaxID=2152917 RepID=UPI00261C033A|nr:hypothetical protein [Methanocaldococcus sp.]MCQ6253576.1 YfhO family protein [Methanocaldococcus sp.]